MTTLITTGTARPRDSISAAIKNTAASGRPAVVAFMTAGFPDRAHFAHNLRAIATEADVVEIGVPFSDPMADGATIQRASFASLQGGFTLTWLLGELAAMQPRAQAPLLLMSYLNPLLAFGLERLPEVARNAGVSGFIIPDLPYEESADMRAALDRVGIALVQMVTPVTPDARLRMLCSASQGFVYAVTMTGTTGKSVAVPDEVLEYMDRVQSMSPVPVCAGFGIRTAEHVVRMRGHVDGVVVGSALVEVLERGEDPAQFLRSLKS
ncbi:MAG: tryptophan synthase subunit alpha [Steroidobacteraceae bacterium]